MAKLGMSRIVGLALAAAIAAACGGEAKSFVQGASGGGTVDASGGSGAAAGGSVSVIGGSGSVGGSVGVRAGRATGGAAGSVTIESGSGDASIAARGDGSVSVRSGPHADVGVLAGGANASRHIPVRATIQRTVTVTRKPHTDHRQGESNWPT